MDQAAGTGEDQGDPRLVLQEVDRHAQVLVDVPQCLIEEPGAQSRKFLLEDWIEGGGGEKDDLGTLKVIRPIPEQIECCDERPSRLPRDVARWVILILSHGRKDDIGVAYTVCQHIYVCDCSGKDLGRRGPEVLVYCVQFLLGASI